MKKYGVLLLCFFQVLCLLGQDKIGTVRGFVYNAEDGEPVIFTNVFLKGTTMGAPTDIQGFFSIVNVPEGDYELVSKSIGFDSTSVEIKVTANRITNKNLFINPSSVKLKEANVSASKIERTNEVKISSVKIAPKQMKHLPTIGGEPDLAQYLQVLPGVVFTGDQGGQLYVRGGTPIQNKVLLDGMVIYNPFHSIGLFSVFETDIIRNVEVLTGGFNAEYGDRISAVIDITTRDGNKKKLSGKVSANTFLAKAILEGPLSKLEEGGGGSSSFLFTAKNSYLDRSSPIFYESLTDSLGLPYSFQDYYGKLSFNSENGSKLNLFGFNYNDRVSFENISDFGWKSLGFGTNFVIVPGGTKFIIDGILNYSDYEMTLSELNEPERTSKIGGFNIGLNFNYFIPDGEFKYGFEVVGFKTTFNFFNSLGINIEQLQNTTELAGFLRYKKKIGNLIVEPSFRMQYYASLSQGSPEPRLGIKYNFSDRLRFKFAGGLYSQNLISSVSDRDVVNLFQGFLSGPDDEIQDVDGGAAKHKLQTSNHLIGGVEIDLGNHIEFTSEVFWKNFPQLININRAKQFPDDPDFMVETGDAYGIDFLIKYEYKNVFVWTTYSLTYVTRFDGNQTYNPHFDRRHNVNFVSAYSFGEHQNWEVNLRWNLGSGFPFTRIKGFYEFFDFSEGGGANYTTANGDINIIYEEQLNQGRLPYYHRLDLGIKRSFFFKGDAKLEANLSVTNAYNRENIFYINKLTLDRINQLPILPSFGLIFSF